MYNVNNFKNSSCVPRLARALGSPQVLCGVRGVCGVCGVWVVSWWWVGVMCGAVWCVVVCSGVGCGSHWKAPCVDPRRLCVSIVLNVHTKGVSHLHTGA